MVPEIGITPTSEFLYFFCDQHFDRLPQLLLKEPRVKTHTREYGFDIIQHGSTINVLVVTGYADCNVESTNSVTELKEKLDLSPQLRAQHLQ